MLDIIADFADNYTFHMVGVPWHEDPRIFRQFKEGLLEMLENFRPEEPPVLKEPTKGEATTEQTLPDSIGRYMMREVLHRRGLLKKRKEP